MEEEEEKKKHATHRSDLLVYTVYGIQCTVHTAEEFIGESSWAFSKRILVVNGFF